MAARGLRRKTLFPLSLVSCLRRLFLLSKTYILQAISNSNEKNILLFFFPLFPVPHHHPVQHRTFTPTLGQLNLSAFLLNQQKSTATRRRYQKHFQQQWTAEEITRACLQDRAHSRRCL